VSPNIIGRKLQQQQYQQQYQTISATTISERASSPVRFSVNADTIGNPTDDPNVKFAAASDGRRSSSPPCSSSSSSSCAIHVGNIPSDATLEGLREFFLERMNKAFHGVTSPNVVRLGMRDGGPRTDAYVEFQEPKVAFRATQLKNRRWHAKKQQPDEITIDEKNPTNDEDISHDKEDGADGPGSSNSSNNSINYNDDLKKKRGAMPLLEIEIWDPTKYNTSDFFPVNENDDNAVGAKSNDVLGSIFAQAEEKEDDANRSDILEDDIVDATRQPSPRTSPSLPRKAILAIEEARESGFLICKNPNKTPKCDHIFAIREPPPQGEVDDTSHQIEVKKARMCHGCAFRGKVCTIHKKNQRRDLLLFSPVVCPFAHIYSFDQLEDSHDVLSILYYVENNDEIEFVPGIGCTPQEYLLRQREGQANAIEVGSLPTESTAPNQQSNPSSSLAASPPLHSQSMEERLRKMCCDLTSVRQELATTQHQLLNSERTRQSLFEQQTIQIVCNATEDASLNKLLLDENDTNIQSLRVEVSRLRNDLQETNQKWEASELAMENNKRDYALLQEKHQHQKVISQLSTERLQLEVVRLKEELQQSQDDYELLKHNKQLSASPTSPTYLEDSWPEGIQLDNFLERSIPSLMQMTNELPLLQSPPKLTDIPLDHLPSCHTPYKPAVDCNPMQPPGSSPTIISKKAVPTDEDSLRSEISYLMSCYGNQVSATNGASTTTVTRFLKLPMTQYNGRDVDVALVLTLPKGYPWNGIVKVDSDPRLSNHFGADLQYRKIVSKSVSGLLNMCRWESEACQGKPHVLIKIMKSAERWVENDWKIIQKKNWVIQEHSEGSSLLPASS
jgi:RNA recognition motif-containing protein